VKSESAQQDSVAVQTPTEGSKIDRASLSERARRLLGALDDAWNRGDVDALDGVLHEGYVRHGRTRDRWTRTEFKRSVLATRAALPDLTMTIEDCVEDGDRIAVHWRSTGTHRGAYLGVLPTGRIITMHGATFSLLVGDRIAEEWATYDRGELLKSVGIPVGTSLDNALDADTKQPPELAAELVRGFHRKFVTGVTVVTTQLDGVPKGLAVNAFASISIEPPLVMVCVQTTSSTYEALVQAEHFGVNILAADQLGVAQAFASKGSDKFAKVRWHPAVNGSPLIDNACAHLEAEIGERLQAHTHTIFVGRIVHSDFNDRPGLLYGDGKFFDGRRLQPATVE